MSDVSGPTNVQMLSTPAPEKRMRYGNVVIIGPSGCGKTTLFRRFAQLARTSDSDVLEIEFTIGTNEYLVLKVFDTSGNEEHDRLRPLAYANANLFLLTFDVSDPKSFETAMGKFRAEIQHFVPEARMLLVGLKGDLRRGSEDSEQCVSVKRAQEIVGDIARCQYFEVVPDTNDAPREKHSVTADGLVKEAAKGVVWPYPPSTGLRRLMEKLGWARAPGAK
jgi:Rho family protein